MGYDWKIDRKMIISQSNHLAKLVGRSGKRHFTKRSKTSYRKFPAPVCAQLIGNIENFAPCPNATKYEAQSDTTTEARSY